MTPLDSNAQEWPVPTQTLATPLSPAMASGIIPKIFPQHFTVPSVSRAHECLNPAATPATPVDNVMTPVGVGTLEPHEPFPSWHAEFDPQHLASPEERTAQACSYPAL